MGRKLFVEKYPVRVKDVSFRYHFSAFGPVAKLPDVCRSGWERTKKEWIEAADPPPKKKSSKRGDGGGNIGHFFRS